MTALQADNQTLLYKGDSSTVIASYPVADNVKIYKGALVNIDTAGYARPATDTASYICAGRAVEQADNTVTGHAAGGIRVRVRSGCRFRCVTSGMAQANVGAAVEITDDNTIALTSTNHVKVGRILEFESATAVWVFIPTPGSAVGG